MTDEEFDDWMREANADVIEALNQVVETERNLARLKRRAWALEMITDRPHDPGE